jgi:hemerythrin-like domain-containing protein
MRQAIEHHFDMEEKVFFPRFEAASGMTMGPTQVMRQEHAQMRDLFAAMEEALAGRDADAYLGDAETLLIMMQQHNAKEEQILYPMLDAHLGSGGDQLIEEARGING